MEHMVNPGTQENPERRDSRDLLASQERWLLQESVIKDPKAHLDLKDLWANKDHLEKQRKRLEILVTLKSN